MLNTGSVNILITAKQLKVAWCTASPR